MKNLLHVTLEPLQNTLSSHEKPPFGSPLAFMASLQTNSTIDIGEPLQPTLSETIDYDRFFLAEHDIYGSSRLGMRQYLPREYVYEWDVDKSAEDNMISRDSSEFTYRRPWYNNATQSLYGWSGNFRPFIYYTWQGPVYSQRIFGQKRYELTNHLGNVMAVVADKVTEVPASIGIPAPSPALKRAALTAVYDYYPFGMLMPSRFYEDESDQMLPITRTAYVMHIHYITIGGVSHPIDTSYDADYNYVVLKSKLDEFGKDYRFGFNGHQKDNEIAGIGNHIDFGARGLDSRIGRWWTLDPYASHYPAISPYSFGLNNPVYFIDKGGKYIMDQNGNVIDFSIGKNGAVTFVTPPSDDFTRQVIESMASLNTSRAVLLSVKNNMDIGVQYREYPSNMHDEDMSASNMDDIEATVVPQAEYDLRTTLPRPQNFQKKMDALNNSKYTSEEDQVFGTDVKTIKTKNTELYNKQVVLIDVNALKKDATNYKINYKILFISSATEESLHTQQKTEDKTPNEPYREKEHEKEVQPIIRDVIKEGIKNEKK